MASTGTRSMPATLRKYQALQRKKKSYCAGKATKTDVAKAAKTYIDAAVAKGQTKTEATQKANRVLKSGCKMTANIGKKRKPAARKTASKRRTRR